MRVPLAFALVGVVSCSEANQQTYAQAALATSLAVVSVGVYRAVTHDCWAHCSPGYLCNRESGLCEQRECVPDCEVGSHCFHNARGEFQCVPNEPLALTLPP